jgi:hypothetical protein
LHSHHFHFAWHIYYFFFNYIFHFVISQLRNLLFFHQIQFFSIKIHFIFHYKKLPHYSQPNYLLFFLFYFYHFILFCLFSQFSSQTKKSNLYHLTIPHSYPNLNLKCSN